jgi:hypothetical protein
MSGRGYTVLGWIVYQFASRAIKYKLKQNRAKIGAAAVIAAVLIGGIVAARSGSGD